jgi:hydrocephalus-inducing protein
MLAIPIKAQCLKPRVKIEPSDLVEYGQCFLKHEKEKLIKIVNEDNLPARFEFTPQDDASKRIAIFKPDKPNGIIPAHSTQIIKLSLHTEILSKICVQAYIRVDGHPLPTMLTLYADSIGPKIKLDKQELDFGNKQVLVTHKDYIQITNISEIEAEYTAFTKQKDSIWKVVQRHDVLKPGETKTIEV